MSNSLRQPEILEIARQQGKVTVEGLARHFDVTLQTIRRDLTELTNTGKLERVYGGAILASGISNVDHAERQNINQDEKAAIARACAAEIPEGASVFVNIGTSTEAVARELLGHQSLLVMTNDINVANILVGNPNCRIIIAGGVLRRADGGLIGNLTTKNIEQFKFDYAIIGCSAIDEDGDLMDFDIQEVDVSQTIIRQARKTFLVCDHSKFRRTAPACITSLRSIDTFFTDRPLPDALASRCAGWGTRVRVCHAETGLRTTLSSA